MKKPTKKETTGLTIPTECAKYHNNALEEMDNWWKAEVQSMIIKARIEENKSRHLQRVTFADERCEYCNKQVDDFTNRIQELTKQLEESDETRRDRKESRKDNT